MTHAVETMAYTGETPWHGLGNPVSNDLTPKQMLRAAGLNWSVEKRPMFFIDRKGEYSEVPDKHALTRIKDDEVLSVVGNTYKPVQNEEAFSFFKRFTDAGGMTMETAGSLWGGRYVWGLARIGHDFNVGRGDKVQGYLLLMSPHVQGKSMLFQFTPVRVVCWNTLTWAIGSNLKDKGTGTSFRYPHLRVFDAKAQATAEEALGLAQHQMDEFKAAAKLLASVRAPDNAVSEYFNRVLDYDPTKAKKNQDGSIRVPHMLPKLQAALEHAPGQTIDTAEGTWWGAFNSVTYVVDHATGRDRGTALRNAWVGTMAHLKRKAFDLAVEAAA